MRPDCKIINNNTRTSTTTIAQHRYVPEGYFMNLLLCMYYNLLVGQFGHIS